MILESGRFGTIEVDEENAFHFTYGIPGFEELKRFVFLREDDESPFAYMHSIDDGNVSFIVVNPFIFFPNYDFEISVEIETELGVESSEEILVWSIITAQDTLESATANLLAPIVLNVNRKLGGQVVLHHTEYQTKHLLFPKEG
jgi:flagellar assembly factor FliW